MLLLSQKPTALQWTLVAQVGQAAGPSGATITVTSPISTIGADLFVVGSAEFVGYEGTLSDSQNNSWVMLDTIGQSNGTKGVWYYATNPKTSSSHTFTITGPASHAMPIILQAWSGSRIGSVVDQHVGNFVGPASSVTVTPLTPSQSNCLVLTFLAIALDTGVNSSALASVSAPFTPGIGTLYASGITYGGRLASLVQGAPAPLSPTWSAVGETWALAVGCTASFFPAG